MGSPELKQETAIEAMKASPAVAGTVYSTLTLNQWVAIATIAYITIQAAILLHKHYWSIKDRKKNNELSD